MNSILKGLALDEVSRSIIMVAGVGGAGGNALNHMIDLGINDVTFMAANTDAQALEKSSASIKVQMGTGLGAGNDPERGSQYAKESVDEIIKVLQSEGTKMLFITAGMGGGTGTGASPIIARAAQELDILTVAIVTMPFADEGPKRNDQARRGIEELRQHTDSLLILSNDSIVQLYPDLPYDEGFWRADDVLATAVKGIAEIITGHGTVNVDFADVNAVMRGSGRAFMGSGRASGENRAMDAVEASVSSLLLNHSDIVGAKDILLNISYGSGKPVSTKEAADIRRYLQKNAGGTANLIWGTALKPSLDNELELTIIATGFPGEANDVVSVPMPQVAKPVEVTPAPAPAPLPQPVEEKESRSEVKVSDVVELNRRIFRPDPEDLDEQTSLRPVSKVATAAKPEAAPRSTNRYGDDPQPEAGAGTVQWKGVDRYQNIDEAVNTPAWVRHNASLVNQGSVRAKTSATPSPEEDDEPQGGTLFE